MTIIPNPSDEVILSQPSTAPHGADTETASAAAFSPHLVLMVKRRLTRAQRLYVKDGAIHGGCTMATVRVLRAKRLFELVIDSPNGQCGFMRLTALGEAVRAALIAAPASPADAQSKAPDEPK